MDHSPPRLPVHPPARRRLPGYARLAVPLAAVLLGPTRVAADEPDLVTKMTAGRLERTMKSFGDVKTFTEIENNTYGFEVNGLRFLLFNRTSSMQLRATFGGTASASRVNEWNRDKRFSKAYLNTDNHPVLEADIDLEGGVTQANVEKWMKMFVASVALFKKHLEE